MQVAILSDIHGNRHAFEAVLDDVAGQPRPRRSGAWATSSATAPIPTTAVALARQHADVCLAGNHDLAVTGDLALDEFSTGAALAARWTQEVIDAEPSRLAVLAEARGLRARRRALPRQPARPGLGVRPLARCWPSCASTPSRERLCLVGHSHVALSFVRPEGEPATGDGAPRRRRGRPRRRRVAAQPRQRRPAARRRPARGLAAARHRAPGPRAGGGSSTTSRARRRRSAPRACRTRWPSAWSTVSEDARPAAARRAPAGRSRPPCSSPAAAATAASPRATPRSLHERSSSQIADATTAPGDCAAAQRAVAKAQNAVLALPDTVDARLRQRLQSGIAEPAPRSVPRHVPAETQTQTQQTPDRHGTTDTADHRHDDDRHRHDRHGHHRTDTGPPRRRPAPRPTDGDADGDRHGHGRDDRRRGDDP